MGKKYDKCVFQFTVKFVCPNSYLNLMLKLFMYFSYKGQETDTLAELRYAKFTQLLTTSTTIDPSELPPTERAAHFHALRVHLQVAQWTTLDLRCLHPTEWGWNFDCGKLVPIKTDLDPAPQFLLNFIRCNCKVTTRNPCGGLNCSCRKHGLESVTCIW